MGSDPMGERTMDLDRILRISQVLDHVGVSSATLYRWISDERFPRPVQLGPNSVGWRESAVREWLASREPAVSESNGAEPSATGADGA